MVEKTEIPNLLGVKNETSTQELLKKINEKEQVTLSIAPNGKGKKVQWKGECVFIVDACRLGNEKHNTISVIRDLLKKHHPGHWTRKTVELLVDFEANGINH